MIFLDIQPQAALSKSCGAAGALEYDFFEDTVFYNQDHSFPEKAKSILRVGGNLTGKFPLLALIKRCIY